MGCRGIVSQKMKKLVESRYYHEREGTVPTNILISICEYYYKHLNWVNNKIASKKAEND